MLSPVRDAAQPVRVVQVTFVREAFSQTKSRFDVARAAVTWIWSPPEAADPHANPSHLHRHTLLEDNPSSG